MSAAMLDRGTKIYAAVLGVLVLVFTVAVLYQPPKVRELNALLAADARLAAYPYPFRVVRVEGAIAVMASPRSAEMPVQRIIGVLHPELAARGGDDPEFQRAQQLLADYQTRARDRVLSDADINEVRWELDVDWLRSHGTQVP